MNSDNPEDAMTFGELLTLIGEQQRRLSVLESAFSSLSLCLDEKTSLRLIHSLRLHAQKTHSDENMQRLFSHLADQLDTHRDAMNISPDANV